MRRTLLIWMAAPEPAAAALWQLREPADTAPDTRHGTVADALSQARQLAEQPGAPRIALLIPGESAFFASLDLPIRNRTRLLQAVPYALEDQLAEDLNDLHFSVGQRSAGKTPVVVLAKRDMDRYLGLLADHGLRADAAHVDLELISVQPAGAETDAADDSDDHAAPMTVFLDAQRLIIAQSSAAPTVLDASLADMAAEQIAAHDGQVSLIATRDADPTAAAQLANLPGPQREVDSLLDVVDSAALSSAINLLQGAYRNEDDISGWWRPWRLAAGLLVALLGVILAQHLVDRARLSHELDTLRDANIAKFQTLFPDQVRVVDLRAQLEQQMALLRGDAGDTGLLFLLDQSRLAIGDDSSFELEDLQYRDGALYLSLEGKAMSGLEALEQRFGQRQAVRMTRQSANSTGDSVKVRLKIQPAGAA